MDAHPNPRDSGLTARRGAGIDFGTTNSAVALVDGENLHLAQFQSKTAQLDTFRSVLFFETNKPALAGPEAIDGYLEDHDDERQGRLIQSIKSLLASRVFTATQIGHRRYNAEDLVTIIVRALKNGAESQLGDLGRRIVVGRPVQFVGAETPQDDAMALDRLRNALASAGFPKVTFEYEPVGAAYFYESRLDHDELILIADFGGGTSDFSLLPVGPSMRGARKKRKVLGTEGIALAGDAFDARIVRNVVSPLLGEGSSYQSLNKSLLIPSSVYRKLERWHHLSFLRSPETLRMLKGLRVQAHEPAKIDTLIEFIENDFGFHLHRAVQRTKFDLSRSETSLFKFHTISKPVTRAEFEDWIEPEIDRIAHGVENLLNRVSLTPARIDRVFLTGGSSLVPAVRRIFEHRFGPEKISAGDEFTSVARGLALRAADLV